MPVMHSDHCEPSMQRTIDQCYLQRGIANTTHLDPIQSLIEDIPPRSTISTYVSTRDGKDRINLLCFLHEPTILISYQHNPKKGAIIISKLKLERNPNRR